MVENVEAASRELWERISGEQGYRLTWTPSKEEFYVFLRSRHGRRCGYIVAKPDADTGALFPICSERGKHEAATLREWIGDALKAAGLVKGLSLQEQGEAWSGWGAK